MDTWFIYPVLALMAGIVALTPLGTEVLKRRVVFIDLAVAQAATASVIWFDQVLHLDSPLVDQAAATLGAVIISLAVAWVARKWSQQREALIGLIYVAGACLALLGASQHPHGREKLLQLLAADVLWVTPFSVVALFVSAVAMVVACSLESRHRFSSDAWFYAAFAMVSSVAVPALGLFLVFASLIAPALWIERGMKSWAAMLVASLCGLIGLLISWMVDAPSGPTVVMALCIDGVCAMFRHPQRDISEQQSDSV